MNAHGLPMAIQTIDFDLSEVSEAQSLGPSFDLLGYQFKLD